MDDDEYARERWQMLFDDLIFLFMHPVRRAILGALWKEEGLSFIDLSACVQVNHGKLGQHFRRMKELVERDHETGLYRLSYGGRLFYEWYVQALSEYERRVMDISLTPERNPSRYVERLRLGDHAILIYDDEAFKRAVVYPFLKVGLLRDLAVVYLVSERKMDQEATEMRRNGMDVEGLKEEGDLTFVSAEEWYLRQGEASGDTIVANLLNLAKSKISKGYGGLQVAGEVGVFFNGNKTGELLAYERKIGRILPATLCALCLFEDGRVQPEFMQAHGHILSKEGAFAA